MNEELIAAPACQSCTSCAACTGCSSQVRMCKTRMMPCDHVGTENECPLRTVDPSAASVGNRPTLALLEAMYREMCGTNLSSHQQQVLRTFRRYVEDMGIDTSKATSDDVSYDSLDKYVNSKDVHNVSKIAICWKIQCMFGHKARVFYRRKGFDVRQLDIPIIEDTTKAYRTLSPTKVQKIRKWYFGLLFEKDQRKRVFAMMMLKYAMRNGDVERLKWSSFENIGGRWRLNYCPHKTEKSAAGRRVYIWLAPMDQIELERYRGDAKDEDFVIPHGSGKWHSSFYTLQSSLNADLRAKVGFDEEGRNKVLYELRKLCIDSVFHKYGAEAASAYSGDDFKTVKFNYADTSSLNLHGLEDDWIGYQAA